jgi:pilus assembly protein CpaC
MNTSLTTLTDEPNRLITRGDRTPRLRWASIAAAALAGLIAIGTARAQENATTQPADSTSATTEPAPLAGNTGPNLVASGTDSTGSIHLMVNRSAVVTTKVNYSRVSVGDPTIVAPILVGPKDILLTAKKPGSTQLIIWDDQNRAQTIDVTVESDLGTLRQQLAHTFPEVSVDVSSANGTVVLKGRVPTVTLADQIMQVAAPYSPNPPLNLMEISGGQQVVLQVRFAEVSRSLTSNLGFNAFVSDGKSTFGFGQGSANNFTAGQATGITNADSLPASISLFGSGQFGKTALQYYIEALRSNSLLRILAEPNVMATSGQEADFLAGGEFPYPVPQASGGGSVITIAYKDFGVELRFTPVVLGDGRIRLKVAPEVSSLDFSDGVSVAGTTVPGLTKRTLSTTVELAEGQTFALAGLLQRQINATTSITPLLGDIPVLGALFRSVSYQDNDSELVVLVTPHLVGAMNPGEVPDMPGEKWRYPTEAELFANHDLGGPLPDTKNGPNTQPAQFYGHFGFAPATGATPGSDMTTTGPAK